MGFLKDKCINLGKNNKAVYAVVAIAVVKGIARPIFTMMDKKEDQDTKVYAAIREGLTEVIAIPSYIGMSWLSEMAAGPLTKNMPKKLQDAAKTLSFVGVCVTALFVIPALCSFAIKRVMKELDKRKPKLTEQPIINTPIIKPEYQIKTPLSPVFATFRGYNSNMRVGG